MSKAKEMIDNMEVNESSLSRLWKHNQAHDCGAMTAFRRYKDEGNTQPYSKKEKQARNTLLASKLMSKGYSLTRIHGTYPEGGEPVQEESYFIVDAKDQGTLEKDLIHLGVEFDQDSILFIPKGAIDNKAQAYLVGTSDNKDSWIGKGEKSVFSKGRLGYDSPIYTSYVKGRPYIFEDIGSVINYPATGFGVWGMMLLAKKSPQELVG